MSFFFFFFFFGRWIGQPPILGTHYTPTHSSYTYQFFSSRLQLVGLEPETFEMRKGRNAV
ncbi:uncharacterized protein DS421_12g357000 [Arachis hypogaea]|nr:uncharacterized protein DS421_12g357000 [Arachis hypogaea]